VFTGLVREIGHIESIGHRGPITRIELSAPRTVSALAVGDSLAVNGICLTVTRTAGDRVQLDATEETRRVTTLRRWKARDRVHLEPSLRVGDSIGGHFVLGHVDGVGVVRAYRRRGPAAVLHVLAAPALVERLVPKGSIAVDGVSLTLNEGPFQGGFFVTLVPHTLAETRFGSIRTGDEVNLELDVLAKATQQVGPASARPARAAEQPRPLTLASLLARGWQKASS
jgi:riboflavin synthase